MSVTGHIYTATRKRGMAGWRPQGKSLALIEAVKAILEEYREYLPLTARQVFYRLVGTIAYPKDQLAYANLLEKLNRARRSGLIPFDAIRDDGAQESWPACFTGLPHFWANARAWAEDYRLPRQRGQSQFLELWCEAAGMLPQLAAAVEEYGVPVFSSGGFDSVTVRRNAVERVLKRKKMPTVILHVGDHDPSGCAIIDSLAGDITQFVEDLGGRCAPEFRRVAVTPEQIERYALPEAPPKSTDRRGDWNGGTVQAEALSPSDLRREVVRVVEGYLDLEQWQSVCALETRERETALAQIERFEHQREDD
jgi:hypothetical protein